MPQRPGGPAEDGAGAHCACLVQAGQPPHRRQVVCSCGVWAGLGLLHVVPQHSRSRAGPWLAGCSGCSRGLPALPPDRRVPQLRRAAVRGGPAGRDAQGADGEQPSRGGAPMAERSLFQGELGQARWCCLLSTLLCMAASCGSGPHQPASLPAPLVQAARQKEEEERAELEAYSFRPTISKLARQIKASESMLGGPGAAYQRLYQRASDCTVKRQVGGAAGRSATTAVRRSLRWGEGCPFVGGAGAAWGPVAATIWRQVTRAALRSPCLLLGQLLPPLHFAFCPHGHRTLACGQPATHAGAACLLCPCAQPLLLLPLCRRSAWQPSGGSRTRQRSRSAASVPRQAWRSHGCRGLHTGCSNGVCRLQSLQPMQTPCCRPCLPSSQINSKSARMVEGRQQILRVGAPPAILPLSTCMCAGPPLCVRVRTRS